MVSFNKTDLEFILLQIQMAENGQPPVSPHLAFGLRTVDGSNNNTVPGNGSFGSADQPFPRMTDPVFQSGDPSIFSGNPTSYANAGSVTDADPRIISNLIADQSAANPAAQQAQAAALDALGTGYQMIQNPAWVPGSAEPQYIANPNLPTLDAAGKFGDSLFIPNVTPDAGFSAPYNTWFTLFGQFFDHGLDLVTKGGNSAVFITLKDGDPLIAGADQVLGTADDQHFMVLTRATPSITGAGTNTITPFVDQSQTYSSHPSHQVFLRDYTIGHDGALHSTGKMLSAAGGGMATWADVKTNALKLGILLTDANVNDVPLLATDAYGNFIAGANGFAQVVVKHADGTTTLVEGTAAGLDLAHPDANDPSATIVGTGHAFINDKAHAADPFSSSGVFLGEGNYDAALLDAHYIAGDGRVNENIGLTAVHEVFHAEHNRLIEQTKAMVQAELDKGDQAFASNWVLGNVNLADNPDGTPHQIAADEWNGERLFQAAKFGTETQYQHLVFEEFARKISPNIHLFGNTNIHLDPAITAEFAHAVYRFGHSMLDETLNRYDANGNVVGDGDPTTPGNQQMTLIDAFTNPLAYLAQGDQAAAQLVRGATNQVGNEIDEFVTGALRNNLLGLPLDLAALNIARGRDTGVAPLNLIRNQFFSQTGDASLKAYGSWNEFGTFLKHSASLINFIAAYGKHASLTDPTLDIATKRDHALALIVNGADGSATFDQDAYDFMHSTGQYANDVNSPLAVHATWSTGSVTGVDDIDLWIGGLAEKQNLFGGLLGSTFDFIFRTQMESLQDADRLYYLPRIEGMHFATEIEQNSFADVIMRNTGATHLSANIFLTPEYTVELDKLYVKGGNGYVLKAGEHVDANGYVIDSNGDHVLTDPAGWLHNAQSGAPLIERMADGTIHFLGDDNFFGNTIVMGGTESDDKILAGNADDDTVYGDGGNDILDGGGGNDVVYGGTGDDRITDIAGADVIHGGTGNDVIDAGEGDDLVFGDDGDDLINGGKGIDDVQGGLGNDIILGGEGDDEMQGNEGDDWMEGGDGADILVGDIGAPTGQVPLYSTNDVLDGGALGDKMQGFTGDDIMLGEGGFDKFDGLLGFDWGSFEKETHGVNADMEVREFIPITPTQAAADAVRDFWVQTEAVSGSQYDDYLQGTIDSKADPFNELTNTSLITGLDKYFPANQPVAFSGGNIMMGGAGSDHLEGRGGNDIIDGDAYLHVGITRDENGNPVKGGQIIREIRYDTAVAPTVDADGNVTKVGDIDTAVFSDVSGNYTIELATDAAGNLMFAHDGVTPVIKVTHVLPNGVIGPDGVDMLYNIERLQFSDGITNVPFIATADETPQGTLTITANPPVVGAPTPAVDGRLDAIALINDREGVMVNGVLDAATAGFDRSDIPNDELNFQWQYQDVAKGGVWVNIEGATLSSFTPNDTYRGLLLRVQASYTDGLGVKEIVTSAPTVALLPNPGVNHAPVVQAQQALEGLADTSANAGQALDIYLPLLEVFTDDLTPASALAYTAKLVDGRPLTAAGADLTFSLVLDGTGGVAAGHITGTPSFAAGTHGSIAVLVTATDAAGLSVTSDFVINVLPAAGDTSAASTEFMPVEAPHVGATFNRADLEFVLEQIKMAENGQHPVNPHLAFGLREVAGTNNNIVPGNGQYGSADHAFPRLTDAFYRDAQMGTSYSQTAATAAPLPSPLNQFLPQGTVFDSDPRTISNLIADQTANNDAAVQAQQAALDALGDGYLSAHNGNTPANVDASGNLFIPNVTPDGGLSAPFNTWFTLFGQFFDHGLDLVTKGGNSLVYIALNPDDPLYSNAPNAQNFMVLTRAGVDAGKDGLLGTADDVNNSGTNTITPFVDQSQTYTSHPSHQAFLREYTRGADGVLHVTGKMLSHTNAAGVVTGGQATWADVKANALLLGIALTDANVGNVPMLATDAYGNLILGPNGYAQVVVQHADGTMTQVEGVAGGLDLRNPLAGEAGERVVGIGHAFINDTAHNAVPVFDATGNLVPDAGTDAGNAVAFDHTTGQNLEYDNELLDAHFVAGDGRVNENIGLTAVHEVFHSEHNRLVEQTKAMVQAELNKGDQSFALNWVNTGVSLAPNADGSAHQISADEWNGERLFQAAKFGTETQYQHLVFEEFARKVSPAIHLFGNNNIHLDPAITAEFAHAVYRFGHSMLDETINRFDANGNIVDGNAKIAGDQQMTLIDAFTNPLAYLNRGADAAGEIVRGATSQVGNEIDEFVTGALRNNLLGLPLDLAALNIARGRETGVAPLNLVRNQIFTQAGDASVKPYESWTDFGNFLKHSASLVNFVAAYGTHSSIAGDLVHKRAAALALVENGVIGSATFDQDAYDFMHSTGAYANKAAQAHLSVGDVGYDANAGVIHSQWSTGSTTGVDSIDLWIGGLAEKQNLFGGLLGSTFDFIFRNQMEALQDADRLYYLPRLEGMQYATQIEQNSFAEMIMNATGTKHLSANIFLTPEYTVEASKIDPNDTSTWTHNPETGKLLVEVLQDGTIHFLGDDNFFGNTIVMGGTEGDDKLISGNADDDTVWGDGGNDTLDGGGGNDIVYGGTGNDKITDVAGDDVLHGGDGNDTMDGGTGADIMFGDAGNDLMFGGKDIDDMQGGLGNDIMFAGEGDDEIQGNEGDDWMEGGDGGDVLVGDVGAPTGQVPLYGGNDVLDGGALGDKMQGFSGDDIMLGEGGFDKFDGLLGFDWGSYEKETHGVNADMEVRLFVPAAGQPAGDAVRDFWVATEAISGSQYDDVLSGTNDNKADPFNELTNVSLIKGLDKYFPSGPVAFSGGNIMFGGDGSDKLEGRLGSDIIDGDAYLHVDLTRDANGNIFAGSEIIREIRYDTTPGDTDTAVFADVSTNYIVTFLTDAAGNPVYNADGVTPVLQVQHILAATGLPDPTDIDTLYNIERLQFSDVTVEAPFAPVNDFVPQGGLTILDNLGAPLGAATLPLSGVPLSVASTVSDLEGVMVNGVVDPTTVGFLGQPIPLNELNIQWQYQDVANGDWVNIAGATGVTFTPTDFFVGNALRVTVHYTDGLGVAEQVISAPTALLAFNPAVNHAPVVVTQTALPGLPDTTATVNQPVNIFLPLLSVFTDDQTPANQLVYTAKLANGQSLASVGLTFTVQFDGTGLVTGAVITGTPPANFLGAIGVAVKATDAGGLSTIDTFLINVVAPGDSVLPAVDTNNVQEDITLTAVGNVLANDLQIGTTGPLTVSTAGEIVHTLGKVTIKADGTYAYTLNNAAIDVQSLAAGETVVDSYSYTATNGKLNGTGTLNVNIAGNNDAPTIAKTAVSVDENTTAVPSIGANDVDHGAVLTFGITGGADKDAFTINTSTGELSFVSPHNFEAPTAAGGGNVYEVQVTVTDEHNAAVTKTIAVTVKDVNEAPVITSGEGDTATYAIPENTSFVTQVTSTDEDRVHGDTATYSLIGGKDLNLFTINASTGELSIVPQDFEALIGGGDNAIFQVVVQVKDSGGLIDTQAISVTITDANDPPVITSDPTGAVTVNENSSVATTVVATDQDNDPLVYSIVGGADALKFDIDQTSGVLSFRTPPDFENPGSAAGTNVYDVQVQVTDNIAAPVKQTLAITVADVNEAPVITSDGGGDTATVSTPENTTGLITTVSFTDQDAIDKIAGNVKYALSGADASLFNLGANGELSFKSAPNFENPNHGNVYSVTVTVTDKGGLSDSQAISVNVTDVAEAPVITSNGGGDTAALTVNENGTLATTVTVTDPDAGTVLSYTLTGADADKFAFDATTGALTFVNAPDFEVPGDAGGDGVYDVVVNVADQTGLTDAQALAITIANVNEAPVITSNNGDPVSSTVNENQTATGVQVTYIDQDAGGSHTYTLLGADAGRFNIDATTGVLTFKTAPNFEDPTHGSVYNLTVKVADQGGLFDTQDVSITVANVNEAPVITSNGAGATAAISMAENLTAVTTVTVQDPDANTTLAYSLSGADAALFNINQATGALSFITAPDFEIPTSAGGGNLYQVTVTVSDGQLTDQQALSITVTDVVGKTATLAAAGTLPGTPEADTLTGSAGNDIIIGLGGDDLINGAGGADQMIGGKGNDTYIVDNVNDTITENPGEGIDSVQSSVSYLLSGEVENLTLTGTANLTGTGNASDNVIIGNSGANTLNGGGGNDTLDGGLGNDTMNGGAGNDTYIVNAAADVVNEVGGEGTDLVLASASYTLSSISEIENLTLTGTANINATGNQLANVLTGNSGNNALNGGLGADTMIGGLGDDTYVVDNLGDKVIEAAAEGNDLIQTTLNAFSLATPALANIERLSFIGVGDFTGTGNALANTIIGGGGNDILDGGLGNDNLQGGLGNDTYYVDSALDVATDVATNGGIDIVFASSSSYTLSGNIENLTFNGVGDFAGTGNTLANILVGGGGNDTLNGGTNADTMKGGAGNDTYIVDNAGDVIVEDLGNGNDTVNSSISYSLALMANVENLTLTGTAGNSATGNDLANVLTGNAGANTLDGGLGADTMSGGAGNDIYIVDDVGDVVGEGLAAGTDTVRTTLSSYTLAIGNNVENLTFTGAGSFTGVGNELANVITGGASADSLSGGDGNDTLNGAGGNDTLTGGLGNDTYQVDSSSDVVVENGGEGTDTVQSTANAYTLSANVETLTFTGVGNFTGTGSIDANTINGGAGADVLNGKGGNDTLNGNAGNDTFIYNIGDGTDTWNGGADADTLNVLGDTTNNSLTVIYQAGVLTRVAGGTPNAIESITADLGQGTDTLSYAGTANTQNVSVNLAAGTASGFTSIAGIENVVGGAGNDTIQGNSGNNQFTGAAGTDTFVFAAGFGNDTITDFDADAAGGQDLMDLRGLGITAATFAANVTITNFADHVNVQVGANSITISGAHAGTNAVTQADFLLN
jgi:VCBS repeat-containing protein